MRRACRSGGVLGAAKSWVASIRFQLPQLSAAERSHSAVAEDDAQQRAAVLTDGAWAKLVAFYDCWTFPETHEAGINLLSLDHAVCG